MSDELRAALTAGMADALTKDWPGDTRRQTAPAVVDYLLSLPAVRSALGDPATAAPSWAGSCSAKRGRYWCTLENGHEGRHSAGGPGGVVFKRWVR